MYNPYATLRPEVSAVVTVSQWGPFAWHLTEFHRDDFPPYSWEAHLIVQVTHKYPCWKWFWLQPAKLLVCALLCGPSLLTWLGSLSVFLNPLNWLSCGSAPSCLSVKNSLISKVFQCPVQALFAYAGDRRTWRRPPQCPRSWWWTVTRGSEVTFLGARGKSSFPPLHHLVLSPTAPQGFPMYWNQEPVQHGIMNTGHRLLFLSALL